MATGMTGPSRWNRQPPTRSGRAVSRPPISFPGNILPTEHGEDRGKDIDVNQILAALDASRAALMR
jgi:hypothetical protein